MRKTLLKTGLLLAAGLASAQALAQDSGDTPLGASTGELGTAARGLVGSPQTYFSRENFTVDLGAGFTNITNQGTDQVTGAGGSWVLRGIFGSNQAIGFEGAYLGAAYPITALTGDQGTLVSNGLEALARIGYPIRRGEGFLMPYFATGLGFTIFNSGWLDETTSGIDDGDAVFNIPIAFGIGGGYEHLNLDLRFSYRPGWGASMFDNAVSGGSTGLNTIAVTAFAGYRF